MFKHPRQIHRAKSLGRRRGFSRLLRLEDRIAPALSTSFDTVSGLLTVTSDGSDAIVLGDFDRDGRMDLNGVFMPIGIGGTNLTVAEVGRVVVNGGPGPNNIDLEGFPMKWDLGKQKKMRAESFRVTAVSDPDYFNESFAVQITGGAGNDTITGSIFSDDIDGGSGNDKLFGGSGNDLLRCELSDLEIDGGGGTNVGLMSLSGLPVGTSELSISVNLDTEQVTVTTPGLPTATTLTRLPLLNYASIEFASIKIEIGAAGISANAGLTCEFEETDVTSIKWSGSGDSDDRPTEEVSFSYGKIDVEYHVQGKGGDDRFVVTPGRSKVTIDGGAGSDTVEINHGGYPFTQTPTDITVSTKATVSLSNVESTQPVRIISGDAALEAVRASGFTATCIMTDAIGDSSRILTVTVTNTGPVTFTDGSIHTDGWNLLQLTRTSGGPGVDFEVRARPDPDISDEALALGAYPYDPSVTMSFASLPGGTTATGTVEYQSQRGGTPKGSYVIVRLGSGTTRYEFKLVVTDDTGRASSPVTLAGVNPLTGQASSDAAVTLVGADAGGTPLVRSSSTQIDPQVIIPMPSSLDHLYLGHIMVDVRSGTLEPGNGSAYEASVDYTGRYITFVSDATNLDPLVLDLNGTKDVFVRDTMLGTTTCVSVTAGPGGPTTGNGESRTITLKGIARNGATQYHWEFESKATDIVPGLIDTNNDFDVFRYDSATGIVECLSLNTAATGTGNKGVFSSTVSADGETVCWLTEATDVNPGGGTGLQIAMSVGGTPSFVPDEFGDFSARIKLSGDGGTLLYWTATNVSALAGVPDTNGTFDLLAIHPTTGVVVPLSINSAQTAMGDGSTPAFVVGNDAPAICFDGSIVVVTSSADNLLAGPPTPTTGGVFRYRNIGTSPSTPAWVVDRIDTLSVGGFGGDNSQVTISADGDRVAWVSHTNYQSSSPATFPHEQVWTYMKLPDVDGETRLASGTLLAGNPLFEPGVGTSSNPFYSNEGVLFQSNAVLADLDLDGLQDVVVSRLDRTLTWVMPTGNGADAITIKRIGNNIEIQDAVTSFVITARDSFGNSSVYIRGADNEPDAVTIDFSTGLTSLSNITVDGGAGSGNTAKVLGQKAKAWMVNNRLVQTIFGDDGIHVVAIGRHELEYTPVNTSTGLARADFVGGPSGGGGSFDIALDISVIAGSLVITRDPGTPNEQKTKIDAFTIKQGVRIDASSASIDAKLVLPAGSLPAGSTFEFTGSQANDKIDAGLSAYSVTIDGGAGDDTITGSTAADVINGGSGKNTIKGNSGLAAQDTYLIPSGSETSLLDNDENDIIDFSLMHGGVTFNMDSTMPQPIAPTGESVTLHETIGVFIGSPTDDDLIASIGLPKITPKIAKESHGKFRVSAPGGDRLTYDAKNLPTADLGGRIVTTGYGDVLYDDQFEYIDFINMAPNQVVITSVNDDATQRSMVTKLQTSFNFEPMWAGQPSDAFEVVTKVGGVQQPISVSTNTVNGFTHVTITPLGSISFVDGRYLLRVKTAQIVGGIAGGDYSFEFHRIFGDITGDANVAANDFIQFRLFFNGVNPAFDFNGDGAVAASDFIQFRLRFNGSV